MQNLQIIFCLPCITPRTWCSTRRSTAAVDLFGRGAAVNSVLFDSGIAYRLVQCRKGLCLCWSYRISGKYPMSTFTFYPNGPPISTLYYVCTNAVVTIMMFDAKKTSINVRNIRHRFIQPGQNVSLPNPSTLKSHSTFNRMQRFCW